MASLSAAAVATVAAGSSAAARAATYTAQQLGGCGSRGEADCGCVGGQAESCG